MKFFLRITFGFFALFLLYSIGLVVLYKYIPPPVTPIMMLRMQHGQAEGIQRKWVDWENINPNLFRACIGSEDARFLRHEGIDWKAVKAARRYNAAHKGKKTHGASTITMQTAKNIFLTHHRNYLRKGLEVYFTYLIEYIWGKKRILEVYVNSIEWGNGLYGCEEAAQVYFGKSALELSKRECALMAAVLPNPRRWQPNKPTPYVIRRANFAQGRMGISLKSIEE